MCGIFGVILNSNVNIYPFILNGLKQLQNRGYDSAGLSVIQNRQIKVHKYSGEDAINKLEGELCNNDTDNDNDDIYSGIGHNRWATHGIKNDINAHPHLSNNKMFSIVHNGIIENYNELKQLLLLNGFTFYSQTDTEVIVNLIEFNYKQTNNVFNAIKQTISSLRGTYGLVIQCLYEPNKLFCVRNGSPLLVGKTEDMVIITSEQSGFCNIMNTYITLHTDDICTIEKELTSNNIQCKTSHVYVHKNVLLLNSELTPAPFEHWTLKEINEQPMIVLNAINNGGRIKNNYEVKLGGLEIHIDCLKQVDNLIILGCGTSYFAGLYGMYFFKQICNFNTVQVFDGADFNDFDIPTNGHTAVILVSQSGETKDLHRCINIAKNNNMTTIGLINVVDSLIAREVDCGIYCNAGKEVGVASTKSFTSQVVCLALSAIWFSQLHNVSKASRSKMISDLHNLSNDIQTTLECCKNNSLLHNLTSNINNMFLLGKGTDECIAKEGALKIKEISYIHAEGYSTSSLKHGPFALLDETFPVILLNLDKSARAKTLNCYEEIASRNSPILIISNDPSIREELTKDFCNTIFIPENKTFASLLGIIPIQFLAYNISVGRGLNPDKPKNLAKVVTVE